MRPASLRTRSFDVELPCVRTFCPSRFEYVVNTKAGQLADPDLRGSSGWCPRGQWPDSPQIHTSASPKEFKLAWRWAALSHSHVPVPMGNHICLRDQCNY